MEFKLEGKVGHLQRTAIAFMALDVKDKSGTYVEIGAHRGRSIVTLSGLFKNKVETLHIKGYDIFGNETVEFHKFEDNGKGAGNISKCIKVLNRLSNSVTGITYELIEGYTTDTLKYQFANWAYIDGGHSYETVKWDHQQLKDSSIIIFDDADLEGVNKYLWEIKDQYKLYDVGFTPKGHRQVAIVNDVKNYNFEKSNLSDFIGCDPTVWKATR